MLSVLGTLRATAFPIRWEERRHCRRLDYEGRPLPERQHSLPRPRLAGTLSALENFTGNGTDDVLLQNGGSVVDWIMNNGVYESGNVLTTAVAGLERCRYGGLHGQRRV